MRSSLSRCIPTAARVNKENFYVDDLLTGADNKKDAENLQQELKETLRNGDFLLDKWMSNSMNILENMYQDVELKQRMDNTSTELLIRVAHIQLLHGGLQVMMNYLRQILDCGAEENC